MVNICVSYSLGLHKIFNKEILMPQKKLIALIPARAGSERIKNKNFKSFCGTPLTLLSIISAFLSGIFDDVAVSTDAPDVLRNLFENVSNDKGMRDQICNKLLIRTRPANISGSQSPDCEWIADILDWLGWDTYGHYMICRPTSPFRSPRTIQRAWKEYIEKFNMVITMKSIHPVTERPEKMWGYKGNMPGALAQIHPILYPLVPAADPLGQRGYESQSAGMPSLYIQNGCIDICPVSIIRNDHSRYIGDFISPFFTTPLEGIDLNTELEWQMAEALGYSLHNKKGQVISMNYSSRRIH
jgi:CMP-N,N'-diacetyllegionaminic acid synthase